MSKKQAQSIRQSARLVKPTQKAKDQVLLASDLDLEPLLANNEEEFIFHLQHDALISASIQDQVIDPRLLTAAHASTDWRLLNSAMDKEIQMLQQASTWLTV